MMHLPVRQHLYVHGLAETAGGLSPFSPFLHAVELLEWPTINLQSAYLIVLARHFKLCLCLEWNHSLLHYSPLSRNLGRVDYLVSDTDQLKTHFATLSW